MSKAFFLLDQFSLKDIQNDQTKLEKLSQLYWEVYSELAQQRANSFELIRDALLSSAQPLQIKNWQRVIDFKYSQTPLSTKGSIVDVGGRFNIGQVDPIKFPIFESLYIAKTRETALIEKYGPDKSSKLSHLELALKKKSSIVILNIQAQLDSVIDISNKKSLEPFLEIIKQFKLSAKIKQLQKKLGHKLRMMRTYKELKASLLDENWRQYPMLLDIPSNSQLFGQMVYLSKIQGILFPSKYTKEPNLTIFPMNLKNTDSFVEIEPKDCPEGLDDCRIDSRNF